MSTQVKHEPERNRYVIEVDGRRAGFTSYARHGNVLVFEHTVVREEFSGRGLAGMLVDQALGDVAASGDQFAATCPYIVKWLQTHHQHDAALVHVP